jgi:hypothetical protein
MRREQVIEVLRGALLPLPHVNAAWLGGSDAFGRADELSDVDLQVDVDDGHVAATFGASEPRVHAPPFSCMARADRHPFGAVWCGRLQRPVR